MIILNHIRSTWTLQVTEEEFHDLHHALRMLLKHPFTPLGDERDRLTASADTLWNAHCNQEAQRSA